MPKLKTGEKISWKEVGKRFKQGVDNITPLQKLSNEIHGNYIILLGFIIASIMVIVTWKNIGPIAYGLILIFVGNTWTTLIRVLGMRQQLKFFKKTDDSSVSINELNEYLEEVDKEVKDSKEGIIELKSGTQKGMSESSMAVEDYMTKKEIRKERRAERKAGKEFEKKLSKLNSEKKDE